MVKKDFDRWNVLKKQINEKVRVEKADDVFAHPREIWWFSSGLNVGFEIDGKNSLFERPGVVLKVHNKDTLTIVPISSEKKESYYSYNFLFNNVE